MPDNPLDEVIGWAERTGLVRLAAHLRRHRAACEPLAAAMLARIPDAEAAVSERQARMIGRNRVA